jgi:hypothetical protein
MPALDTTISLIDLDDAKDYLDIESDDAWRDQRVQGLINAASAAINSYLGHTVKLTSHTEYLNGAGRTIIMVQHRPITEASNDVAVYLDATRNFGADTAVDHDEIGIDEGAGIIELPAATPKGIKTVMVTYDAGYPAGSIPADIQEACRMMVRFLDSRRDSIASGVSSITIGDGTATYSEDVPIPEAVRALLDNYDG